MPPTTITGVAPLALDPSLRSRPFQQFNPLQGFSTGGGMADAVLQAIGGGLFGRQGYFPGGLTNRNPYDQLDSFRLQQLRNSVMQGAVKEDADTAFQVFAGMHRMMGRDIGEAEFKTISGLSNMVAAMGPTAVDFLGPSLVDKFGGYKGSAVVMASEMIHGSRMRMDPLTGRPGMSADSINSLRETLSKDLFSQQGYRQMGMSQGEAGMMFSELQQLGMVGTIGRRQRQDLLREMAADKGQDISTMDPAELDKLKASPEVASRLRAFDAEAVKKSLKDYGKAVMAMQDIFGASGRGEGSMSELINALQQLTGGAMTQIDSADVERMARTTYQLAKNTSIGLEGAMMLSGAAVQQAMSMGLSPVFASETLAGSLGYRAAYQNEGMGKDPAWGLSGINEQMMGDMQLRTAAARSAGSNRAGAVLRMVDAAGEDSVTQGSDLDRYLTAIKAGQTHFVDSTGKTRSIRLDDDPNMAPDDVMRGMLAGGSNIAGAGQMYDTFMADEAANQEFVFKNGLTGAFRKSQGEEFFKMMAADLSYRTTAAFANQGLDTEAAGRLGASTTQAITASMAGMTREQRTDRSKSRDVMFTAAKEHLKGLAESGDADAAKILQQWEADPASGMAMMENLWGGAETFSRDATRNPFGSRSLQDQMQLMDPEALRAAEAARIRAEGQALQQEALAPLRGTGVFRNAVTAIMEAKPGEDLGDIFAKAMGGKAPKELMDALTKPGADGKPSPLQDLQAKSAAFDKISQQFEEASPEEQEKLRGDLESARAALDAAVSSVATTGEQAGAFKSTDAGGKGGRQILAEHMARVGGKKIDEITDEDLEKFWGKEQFKGLVEDLDEGASHKRAEFDKLLESRGAAFDRAKASDVWNNVESGKGEPRPVSFKVEIARLEMDENGGAKFTGDGQDESPIAPGRQD